MLSSREELTTVELKQITRSGDVNIPMCREISPMIESRTFPTAIYFDDTVHVVGGIPLTTEMLPFTSSQFHQWTLVINRISSIPSIIWSICSFNGQIFRASEFLFKQSNCFLIITNIRGHFSHF